MGDGKVPVGVLGCTGTVGQRFVELLENHPYFVIAALGASERSAGRPYRSAVHWTLPSELPSRIGDMVVMTCDPAGFKDCQLVFSGLDSSVAGQVESDFLSADIPVFSNAKNHRMAPDVPLVVPTVNAHHLDIIPAQRALRKLTKGFIVCNANCSTTGLVVALKPLADALGLAHCTVVTMQAISGAGYPGVSAMDITDNVIPYISGEEDKLETEPQKILGDADHVTAAHTASPFTVCATCNRVPVIDGHTECVIVTLKKKTTVGHVVKCLQEYTCEAQEKGVPSAPTQCIEVLSNESRPQPRLDRNRGNGFTVTVGRIRPAGHVTENADDVYDAFKFTLLSHNTILGAAGSAIMNAELAVAKGYIKK